MLRKIIHTVATGVANLSTRLAVATARPITPVRPAPPRIGWITHGIAGSFA